MAWLGLAICMVVLGKEIFHLSDDTFALVLSFTVIAFTLLPMFAGSSQHKKDR